MQFLTRTRREITVMQWREALEKHMKRANDSMECFRRFGEADDLEHLIEDCESILENARAAKKAIEHMDYCGIK